MEVPMLLKLFHAPCDGSEASIGAAIRAIEEQVAAYGRPTHTSAPVVIGKTLLVSVVFERRLVAEASGPADELRDAAGLIQSGDDLSIRKQTRRIEIALIQQAMRQTNGNVPIAAKLLEVSERALRFKLKDYKIEAPAPLRS